MKTIANLLREEDGQGLTEYAFILVGVALAALGAVSLFGQAVYFLLENSRTQLFP